MSGYVEQVYVFEGGDVPKKFFETIYLSDFSARHLMIQKTGINNWGEELWITISAECQETIDYYLSDWDKNKMGEDNE